MILARCQSVDLSVRQSVSLPICQSVSLSVTLSVYRFVSLSVCQAVSHTYIHTARANFKTAIYLALCSLRFGALGMKCDFGARRVVEVIVVGSIE